MSASGVSSGRGGSRGSGVPDRARALEWLEDRLTGVPPALADAVRRLHGGVVEGPEAMARAALGAFERVAVSCGSRDGALDLLAADALLTYAFEAAADPTLGGNAAAAVALAERMGPRGEIGARLRTGGSVV